MKASCTKQINLYQFAFTAKNKITPQSFAVLFKPMTSLQHSEAKGSG